jgi:hypothetical protein
MIGDELYDRESKNEVLIRYDDDLKQHLKDIAHMTLKRFHFYQPKSVANNLSNMAVDEDVSDSESGGSSSNDEKQKVTFDSKLYETEVKRKKKEATLLLSDSDGGIEDKSTDSSMTKNIRGHKDYQKPMNSKNTLCQKRAAMELIAATNQKRQGEKVNKKRKQSNDYKQILEVGDVGLIKVQGNTKAATDHPFVPVMVTSAIVSSRSGKVKYGICSQHGYLKGKFIRQMIDHDEDMTAEVMRIDPNKPGFENNLTVNKASAKFNRLGGAQFCRCMRDCALVKNCSCVSLGKLCRPKCHRARKDGVAVKCSNCRNPNHLMAAEDCSKKKGGGVKK